MADTHEIRTGSASSICFTFLVLALCLVGTIPALAEERVHVISPEVHADRTVTFRLQYPGAKSVLLAREGAEKLPMTRDDQGIWSVTTEALEPDLYGYSFVADGVTVLDPRNSRVKPNLRDLQNVVAVPGAAPLPWEIADVPHGSVHHHFYKSGIVGDLRDFYVYTPPGYDAKSRTRYPVLFLLHGYTDDASDWTSVGQVHLILDNLIAHSNAKPMVVVMPLGYGAPEILSRSSGGFDNDELRQRNFDRFRDTLLTEVMPQVERMYRISTNRQDRAIAGLSMGGAESLYTGLNNLDKFAWIGAFSTGGFYPDFPRLFPALQSTDNQRLRLLWVACGRDDHLIGINRQIMAWLKQKDIQFTPVETAGSHTWMVWRRNLVEFASRLFK
jgi:enterochelin esterase family protein